MYAIISSNANVFAGNKFNFSSANTVLTLVNFFSLIGFTSISYSNLFSPITYPTYTLDPGLTNNGPNFYISSNA